MAVDGGFVNYFARLLYMETLRQSATFQLANQKNTVENIVKGKMIFN